jgi:Leucine-rich repeat (LRR) protein
MRNLKVFIVILTICTISSSLIILFMVHHRIRYDEDIIMLTHDDNNYLKVDSFYAVHRYDVIKSLVPSSYQHSWPFMSPYSVSNLRSDDMPEALNDGKVLSALSHMTGIKEIGFYGHAVTDHVMKSLSGAQLLEHVSITSANVSDLGLSYLSEIRSLNHIDLQDIPITDRGILLIGGLGDAKSVQINLAHSVTGEFIKGLNKVVSLEMDSTNLSDDSMLYLAQLKFLKSLAIRRAPIHGTQISCLSQLPALTSLGLVDCANLRGAELAAISLSPSLEALDIGGSSINDGDYQVLSSFTNLRELVLTDNQLSPDNIVELRQALPNCNLRVFPQLPQVPKSTGMPPDQN